MHLAMPATHARLQPPKTSPGMLGPECSLARSGEPGLPAAQLGWHHRHTPRQHCSSAAVQAATLASAHLKTARLLVH
jgi:hypothetical protein